MSGLADVAGAIMQTLNVAPTPGESAEAAETAVAEEETETEPEPAEVEA